MASRVQLFGNLQFTWEGKPVTTISTNRLQSLLAFLILRTEAPQSREQVASLLWPESDESQARTNLRQLLHHLRRALPASCCLLICDNHTLQWQRAPDCAVDVHEFDRALKEARRGGAIRRQSALRSGWRRICIRTSWRGAYTTSGLHLCEISTSSSLATLRNVLGRLVALSEQQGDFDTAI